MEWVQYLGSGCCTLPPIGGNSPHLRHGIAGANRPMEREHSKLKALSGRDLHHLVRIHAFEASLQIWLAASVGQEPLKLSLFLLFCGPLLRPAFGPCHGFPFSIWDPLWRDRAQPEGSSCRLAEGEEDSGLEDTDD